MRKELFFLVPYVLCAIGYPIIVFVISQNSFETLFFMIGFFIISASLIMLDFSQGVRKESSMNSVPLPPERNHHKVRAEEFYSSGSDLHTFIEKRFDEPPILPPVAPKPRSPPVMSSPASFKIQIVDIEEKVEKEVETVNKQDLSKILVKEAFPEVEEEEEIEIEEEEVVDDVAEPDNIEKKVFVGYCRRCGKKQTILNAVMKKTSKSTGEHYFFKGTCSVCHGKTGGIVPKETLKKIR